MSTAPEKPRVRNGLRAVAPLAAALTVVLAAASTALVRSL
jgi:hypothetical protein